MWRPLVALKSNMYFIIILSFSINISNYRWTIICAEVWTVFKRETRLESWLTRKAGCTCLLTEKTWDLLPRLSQPDGLQCLTYTGAVRKCLLWLLIIASEGAYAWKKRRRREAQVKEPFFYPFSLGEYLEMLMTFFVWYFCTRGAQ